MYAYESLTPPLRSILFHPYVVGCCLTISRPILFIYDLKRMQPHSFPPERAQSLKSTSNSQSKVDVPMANLRVLNLIFNLICKLKELSSLAAWQGYRPFRPFGLLLSYADFLTYIFVSWSNSLWLFRSVELEACCRKHFPWWVALNKEDTLWVYCSFHECLSANISTFVLTTTSSMLLSGAFSRA